MTRGAAFYFANLGADVSRCITASRQGDEARYKDSLSRAYRTLEDLHKAERPEAYEEGLLMLRGLALARATPETLASFQISLDSLIGAFSARIL
ncbi:hypothetical protein A3I46_00045 [Candidatus Kaiserbacteria bacterium RIFCSPLOWO2_02_FULL_54_13]|uniref:Uncharacterized protein n=1 Tax=Candidatus Kaiserbacteria bacterium RIFCSPHIGHO2_02_FULL_54_22 TaxID=1798495 RepID=A0A1F6DMG8_9BACT|nr:MAG: hypothetical protein A3C19_02595 [Candidatus Kaiserbacteria bacterium RIFCSPHIGHO2_02_FULL_54_22]OGG68207.1 MAG: hypothetical protein A3E99_00600 [Candidatus Kaiserbacteria bacterium RIFCSPHIGHO2_12_FULL_54_16]OGG82801.1 MAG: hypothetical protein A3I46_00045 [Candidatus Kaiserbacteria bacterium RIFCSPLOWO2_02_FULL_54_13]OGG90284.1 MAG: hypothetical protein A3G12_02565 [Candidatus Kaiserbacteria bacterium RIFCSPLOWO2_12_FULL_54_10]